MENYNVGATSSVLNSTKHEVCYIESSQAVSLAVLTVLLSIIGTLGNILVLGAVYTTRALQTISNYLLVSMALADLIVTALAQPLFAAFLSAGADGSCTETVEFLFRLFSNASCAASVLNLCVISLERAVIILKPYTYHRLVTKAKFKISIVVIWLIPILYSIMRVVVQKKRVTSMFTVAVMAICFLIIFVSYAIILVQVHRQRKSTRRLRGSKKTHKKQQKRDAVERRVAMTIALVIAVFTVMWFPIILLRVKKADDSFSVAYNWARALALFNSACNPWIYCLRIPEFRRAYKRIALQHRWSVVKGGSTAGSKAGKDFNSSDHSCTATTNNTNNVIDKNSPSLSPGVISNGKPDGKESNALV